MTEIRSGSGWRRVTAAVAALAVTTVGLIAHPAGATEDSGTAGPRTLSGTVVFDERTTAEQRAYLQDQLNWNTIEDSDGGGYTTHSLSNVQFDATTGGFEIRGLSASEHELSLDFNNPEATIWAKFIANAIVEDGWITGTEDTAGQEELNRGSLLVDLTYSDASDMLIDFSQARGNLVVYADADGLESVTATRVSDGSEAKLLFSPGRIVKRILASTTVTVKAVVDGVTVYYDGSTEGTTHKASAQEIDIPVWGELKLDWSPNPHVVKPDPVVVKAGTVAISGQALVGNKLKAEPMGWEPAGVTYKYQWLRDGRNISGATQNTYELKTGDLGAEISVNVVGSHTGASATATTTSEAVSVQSETVSELGTRLSGSDRFATAVAISKAAFDPGVDVAFVANGMDFPDALAGAAAAGMVGGPVLLTLKNSLSAGVKAELTRLKPKKIIVVGCKGAIEDKILNQLKPYATTKTVERYSGTDRFKTSVEISKKSFKAGVDVAYVANGMNFPDALAGAAAAGAAGGPVLLTLQNQLSAEVKAELTRLKPKKIVVLGGTGAVSNSVQTQLKSFATTKTAERFSGANRFTTSVEISKNSFEPGVGVVFIANGMTFPDALAGAAAGGAHGGPVLLSLQNALSDEVKAELKRLKPQQIVVLGGKGAVSEAIEKQLRSYEVK